MWRNTRKEKVMNNNGNAQGPNRFIKLTATDGRTVWANTSNIVGLESKHEGAAVATTNGKCQIFLETPEEILKLINGESDITTPSNEDEEIIEYLNNEFADAAFKSTFGDLTFEGSTKIPTLKIKLKIEKNGFLIGYLAPFRGLCFRVSATKDGDGNYGSSPIIHYKDRFSGAPAEFTKKLMWSAAIEAMSHFCNSRNSLTPLRETPKAISIESVFNKFIDESYKWIFGEQSNTDVTD